MHSLLAKSQFIQDVTDSGDIQLGLYKIEDFGVGTKHGFAL
jgi:hypothetical protein